MDIQQSPAGQIVKSPKGYSAFVPHSLPPTLEWDNAVVNSLSRADFLLGKLAREGAKLPNPHLLMRPFITREAVLSSKIAGTQATLGEILAANAGVHVKQNPADLQEVQNYIKALDCGLRRLTELPLSLRVSRPAKLTRQPLAKRCVNLSIHTASIKQTRLSILSTSAQTDPDFL